MTKKEIDMKKTKKNNKKIIGLVLVFIGIVGLLGSFGDAGFSVDTAMGSVCCIVPGVILILLDKKDEKTTNTTPKPQLETTPSAPATEAPKEKVIPDGSKNYNLFHDFLDGQFLCYEYEQNVCLIDNSFDAIVGNGGKQITFEFEPENEHDNKAVALYVEGKKIGYVYRGQTQDMIHSYYKQGRQICGYLNKYSVAEKTATYKIGFYKPMEYFESKEFSLVKTTKRIDEYSTRAENLSFCNEGDVLTIECDSFADDSYVVYADGYNEIGELPKSAVNFIEENNPRKIYGILNSCEEDENGKLKAKISVYLI